MENPETWDEIDRIVSAALDEIERQRRSGVIGLSPTRIIADALKESGALRRKNATT